MNFSSHDEEQLTSFCNRLAHLAGAYRGHVMLSYCALRHAGQWLIYSAKLSLNHTVEPDSDAFRTSRVLAGRVPIADQGLSVRQLIDNLLGGFTVDGATLKLEPDATSDYSAYSVPLHRIGGERTALAALKIYGARTWQSIDREELAWHLRGAERPFESLSELCSYFDIGAEAGGIEVFAAPVVRVLPSSSAKRQEGHVAVECSAALEVGAVRLSCRVLQGSAVVDRVSVTGASLCWRQEGDRFIACHVLAVPDGAIID